MPKSATVKNRSSKSVPARRVNKLGSPAKSYVGSRAEIEGTDDARTLRNKRQQIVDAAIRIFLSNGYAATSMSAVAAEANVIKQTIYSHFADKDALFIAIVEELTVKHLDEEFDKTLTTAKPKVVLKAVLGKVEKRQSDPQYISLLRVVIGESERFPELARLFFKTVIQRATTKLEKYFQAHPELKIKDAKAAARAYCGALVSCIIAQTILHGDDIEPFKMHRLSDFFIDRLLGAKA